MKVAESRHRKKERTERMRQMLAECRSDELAPGPIDLSSVPGLLETLDDLTADLDTAIAIESRSEFDLKRYQDHVLAHLGDTAVTLAEIGPVINDDRKDLIWRFIAVIFLSHASTIDLWQEGQAIMVKKHEIDRKRQDVFGKTEESARVAGSVGKVEAW